MTLTVRRYTPADEDALFSFRAKIFPQGHKNLDRAHFRWKFQEHPYAHELPFFIMEDDHRIVGTQGYWPFHLKFGSTSVKLGHLVDFNVEEPYRGLPTLRLFKAVCSCSDINFGAYLSDHSRRFFSAANWVDMSALLKNYYLFLHAPQDCGITGKGKFLCRSLRNAIKHRLIEHYGRAYVFTVENTLPHQVDQILTLAHKQEEPFFVKDKNFLAWRYEKSARMNYKFGSLYLGGDLIALAVFHIHNDSGFNRCFIMDIIHNPQNINSVKILLVKLIKHLQKSRDILVVQSSTMPPIGEVFESCGFKSNPSQTGLMLSDNYAYILKKPDDLEKFNFILGDTDFL